MLHETLNDAASTEVRSAGHRPDTERSCTDYQSLVRLWEERAISELVMISRNNMMFYFKLKGTAG